MNRRAFLASVAAALVLDPERALWVPGKKLISIPAPPFDFHSLFQTSLVKSLGFDFYPKVGPCPHCAMPVKLLAKADTLYTGCAVSFRG
jgi:hypothetical protein